MQRKSQKDYEVVINGWLKPSSFTAQIEEERHLSSAFVTCQFFDPHQNFKDIKFNDNVQIKEKETGTIVFDGYVCELPKSKGGKIVTYEFDCFSKWGKAQNILVNRTYQNVLLSDVFKDLIVFYEQYTGIGLGTVEPTTYTMQAFSFKDESIYECIERIIEITGFNYEITPDNKIHFKRYESTRNYNDLWENNIVKETIAFQRTTSNLCNKVVCYAGDKRIEIEDETSRNLYGSHQRTLPLELETEADIREAATQYLNAYKEPILTGGVDVFENRTWKAGQLVAVHIPSININGDLLRITRIRTMIEKGPVKISLYFNESPKVAGTMVQIMKRLKETEKREKELIERIADGDSGSVGDLNAIDQMLKFHGLIPEGSDYDTFQYNPAYDPPEYIYDTGEVGNGTSQRPFKIRTPLEWWTYLGQAKAGQYFELLYNLDFTDFDPLENGTGYVPIDTNIVNIVIDGKGRTIKNLVITSTNQNVGLIGKAQNWTIKNLGLMNFHIEGGNNTGGLIGYASASFIQNCFILGDDTPITRTEKRTNTDGIEETVIVQYSAKIHGANQVGGLVGTDYEMGTFQNCYANIPVQGIGYVGGFIGNTQGGMYGNSKSVFDKCYSAGQVSAETLESRGGFAPPGVRGFTEYDVFYDVDRSTAMNSGIGVGYKSWAMVQKNTYTNYNFETVWNIEENVSYPFLRIFDQ